MSDGAYSATGSAEEEEEGNGTKVHVDIWQNLYGNDFTHDLMSSFLCVNCYLGCTHGTESLLYFKVCQDLLCKFECLLVLIRTKS